MDLRTFIADGLLDCMGAQRSSFIEAAGAAAGGPVLPGR
jgi:hypothetical protein